MLHEVGRSGIEVTYIVHATSAERITNNQHQHWDERSGTFVVTYYYTSYHTGHRNRDLSSCHWEDEI